MSIKWITPVVTALDTKGEIDFKANSAIYENLIQNGMDGILVLGSIGEFFAMTMEEKKSLIKNAVKTVNQRVQLLIGTNCMILNDCIALSNFALSEGADAVAVIPPYYFTLSDSAIEDFYAAIAKQVNGKLYLYNFPDRTGYDLKPELILKLAKEFPNIAGIKDTVSTMGHTRQIIQMVKEVRPDFEVYSGFDEFFMRNVISGGNGCITGISNFAPQLASSFVDAARKGDMDAIKMYQKKIDSLMEIYTISEHFVPIIKKAMILSGIQMTDTCKKPFPHTTEEETEAIRNLLKKNGLPVV